MILWKVSSTDIKWHPPSPGKKHWVVTGSMFPWVSSCFNDILLAWRSLNLSAEGTPKLESPLAPMLVSTPNKCLSVSDARLVFHQVLLEFLSFVHICSYPFHPSSIMFVGLSTISSQELDHCNEEIKDLEKKKEAPASWDPTNGCVF